MKSHAKVGVIGGGVVGVAALYHLAKKGWGDDVVLFELQLQFWDDEIGEMWGVSRGLPVRMLSWEPRVAHEDNGHGVTSYQTWSSPLH